jgi:23S rRNA pseudouridine1911/1915/1917 synthase
MDCPDIIYEDDSLYVIYKPAGMAVETKKALENDMVNYLRNYRNSRGEDTYVGVINRLDQPVEGIMLCAKTREAAEVMSRELIDHDIKKSYYAVVERDGIPTTDVLEDYLVKDTRTSKAKIVKEGYPRAKKAVLSYKVTDVLDNMKLLDIELKTGRFHQIRCQLAGRNMPILGDRKYGGTNTGRTLALCAYKVKFLHPISKKEMEFQIHPHGEDFQEFSVLREKISN